MKQNTKVIVQKLDIARKLAMTSLAKLTFVPRPINRFFTDKRLAGNPVSRIFRRFFEFKKMRQLMGLQIVVVIVAANIFAYQPAFGFDQEIELTHLSQEMVSLTTESAIRLPMEGYRINQGYHAFHRAIDFGGEIGDPIYSIMNGKVELVAQQRFSYGNHVIVDHGNGIKSLYAHMSKITVEVGQEVDKNTVLGTVGSTGLSTGPHLHLEVIDNGQNINPLSIFSIGKK